MLAAQPLTLPQESTLLDLVQSVSQSAASEEEIVATVVSLINSGRVRLCGTFAGATIILPLTSIRDPQPKSL